MAGLLLLFMLIAIFWLGPSIGAAMIASQKGRSAAGFFVLGLFLGIIAVIIAAVISPEPSARGANLAELMRCPLCSATTPVGSKRCRSCGESMPDHLVPNFGPGRCQQCGAEQPRPQPRLCKVCGRAPAST